ncbi:L-threonylcarbamoyladenylate synthase [Clostridium sp. DL1XJH146]
MKTKLELLNEDDVDKRIINEASTVIKNGGIVVFPTETVYGLGANALDEIAVKKIFEAKGRPQDNPLIIHVCDKNIDKFVLNIPNVAKILIDNFWPGPLTIILQKSERVPYTTSAGLETVGVRMPSNNIARELIKGAKVPIAAPSANISGRPSPTNVERCIEDLNGKVEYILGGEISKFGLESTIIDCTVDPPCVLRPGAITLDMLHKFDDRIYIDPAIMEKLGDSVKPKAPGMKYRHYAPKAPLKIVLGSQDRVVEAINRMTKEYSNDKIKVGVLATDETIDLYEEVIVKSLGSKASLNDIGQNLFELLRSFDEEDVEIILSEGFEEEGIGLAIMNRLKKAAGFDIVNV